MPSYERTAYSPHLGELTATAKAGRQVPAIDGMIAATAHRHGLHVMTRNVDDFAPTGVPLFNPSESTEDA